MLAESSKLDIIIEQQKKQQKTLDTINTHLAALDRTVTHSRHIVTETLVYVKRIQPYIDKAMKALEKAFRMIVNGILNLREEQSEFAGNALEESLDTRFV